MYTICSVVNTDGMAPNGDTRPITNGVYKCTNTITDALSLFGALAPVIKKMYMI